MNMKITTNQLRQIIREEVSKVRRINEVSAGPVGSAELQTLLDVVCDGWKSQFNPRDPSMDAAGGKSVWEHQCDMACDDLGMKIEELIMQVEKELHDGQFGWASFG